MLLARIQYLFKCFFSINILPSTRFTNVFVYLLTFGKYTIYTNICIFEYKIAGFYHNINTETSFLPLLRQFLPSINRGNHCLIFFFFSYRELVLHVDFFLVFQQKNLIFFYLFSKWRIPGCVLHWLLDEQRYNKHQKASLYFWTYAVIYLR